MLKLLEVIDVLKAKPRGAGWIALCPAHDDHTPSLSIQRGTKQEVVFTCQSQHCEQAAILKAITAKLSGRTGTSSPAPAAKPKGWIAAPWDRWQRLSESTYALIVKMREGRGYMPKLDTLRAFDFRELVHKGRTLVGFAYMLPEETETTVQLGKNKNIPRRIPGLSWQVACVKWFDPAASIAEGKTKYIQDGPARRQDVLFGMKQLSAVKFSGQHTIASPAALASQLFIVEGQWDAMCLWELGYNALAVGSSGTPDIAPEILKILAGWQRLFLMLDNDDAGRKCRDKLAAILPAQAARVNYPGDTKDMCEMMDTLGADFSVTALDDIVQNQMPKPGAPIEEWTLGFRNAEDDTPEIVEWLWEYRIPKGALSVLAGNPDVGKSTVLRYIVAAVTTGGRWPDCENKNNPCTVWMAVGEESTSHTVTPGLIAAGADIKRVRYILDTLQHKDKKREDRLLALDKDVHFIRAELEKHPEVGLIIFDPLTGYLGDKRKQNDQDMRQVLGQLRNLAETTGVTILTVDHFNKNFEQDSIHRISGSTALTAVPRTAWACLKDTDDESGKKRIFACIKNNLVPEEKKVGWSYVIEGKDITIPAKKQGGPTTASMGVVRWTGKATKTVDQALAKSAPKTYDASEWLREFLSEGPRYANDVKAAASKAGHSQGTLRNACTALGLGIDNKSIYQEAGTGRSMWRLPAGEDDAPF